MRKTNFKWLITLLVVVSFINYGNAQVLFQDDFSADQGWTLTGTWSIDLANNEPSTDHSGDGNILANPLGTDYASNMDREDVTSPIIDCSSYSNIQLSYWSFSGCENNSWDHMGVEVFDGSNWVEIWNNGSSSFQEDIWTRYTFDVSSYAVGNSNFQVRFYMGTTDGSVQYSGFAIDDFTVENILCPEPNSLNADVPTETDATLMWVAGDAETNWNIEWDTLGFTQGTGNTLSSTDTFVNITGLVAGYEYQFYVQADCGGGETSNWAGPFAFKYLIGDNCSNIQDLATITSPYNATTTDYTGNDISNMLCTAADNGSPSRIFSIVINDGEELHIGQSSNTFDSRHSLSYGNSCPGDSLLVCVDDPDTQEEVWTNNTGSAQTVYFIVAGYSQTSKGDFVLEWNVVTCPNPTNLGVDNLTNNSVDLLWDAVNATTWDIEFDTAGFTPTGTPTFNDVTTNPYNVTGLTAETDYDFYVREVCSASDTSSWTGPFTFTTTADCPVPTDLAVSNITTNTADLTWNGYFATNWDIEFDTAGFTPTGTPTFNDVTTNPYNVTGLTAQTEYEFYVRADCGQNNIDTTVWVGPFQFVTSCESVTTYPWTENFETAGVIPICWNNLPSADDDLWKFTIPSTTWGEAEYGPAANGDHTTGTGYVAWVDDSQTPIANPSILETPDFDLTSLTVPQLIFWYWIGDNLNTSSLRIDIFDGAIWHNNIDSLTANGQWDRVTLDISAYSSTATKIRFTAFESNISSSYESDIAIDDIQIRETPTCPEPTSQNAINIDGHSADLTWITGGASNWNIIYGPQGFNMTDSTAIAVTDTFYNASGLMPTTSYDFYVQDSCAVGDVSIWVGPYTFTTECEAITTFPYYEDFENGGNMPNCWSQEYVNGTHDWIFINGDNSALNAFEGSYNAAFKHVVSGDISRLITPTFDLTSLSTPKIVFAHAQRAWAGDQDSLKLYYRGAQYDSWTLIPGAVWTNDIQTWTVESITLPNPTSTYQIAFEGIDGYGYGVVVDSVVVTEGGSVDLVVTTPEEGVSYTSCAYNGQDTIPFAITNAGDETITIGTTINAWYEYDGAAAVNENFVLGTDLNPTETATFNFAQTVDFTGGTAHIVKVYIDYAGDVDATNDTTNSTFTMQDPTIVINQGDTMYVASGDFPKVLSVGNSFESYFWYNEDSTVTGTNVQLIINDYGTYVINATDADGCVAADTIYVLNLTNINTISNPNIRVYPNPNNGEFTLNANFNSVIDFTIEIININGKTIYSKDFSGIKSLNENIDIDSYAKGVYYIRISNTSFVKQEKVVVY